jgi:hypothetical protein
VLLCCAWLLMSHAQGKFLPHQPLLILCGWDLRNSSTAACEGCITPSRPLRAVLKSTEPPMALSSGSGATGILAQAEAMPSGQCPEGWLKGWVVLC